MIGPRIGDLTVTEVKEFVRESVAQSIAAVVGDPDQGLRLRDGSRPFVGDDVSKTLAPRHRPDRVGGRVTPPVRPHHRAYGSVHGGSSAPLQIPELSATSGVCGPIGSVLAGAV